MGWSDDYLEHHGILGQKWGVRRFQNPDGSLTEKGRRRYYQEEGRNYLNKYVDYKSEYEDTSEGKAKLKAYEKAYDKAYDTDDWTDFAKIEKDFHASGARYAANKMLKEYGSEKFSILVSGDITSNSNVNKIMNDGKAAVEALVERAYVHHI